MVHIYSRNATTHLDTPVTVSVVGARGYTGLETVKQLLRHPFAKLTHAFATNDFSLNQYIQNKKITDVVCLAEKELMHNLTDVVFLATPAEASMKLAPEILAQGKKVIDLSGAFRLKKSDYPKWYGFTHEQNALLQSANYGLVPFANFSESKLVANPGCYASRVWLRRSHHCNY